MGPTATKIALAVMSMALTGSTTFVFQTTQRVSTLEAHRADDVERLTRIENKVDRLLEKSNGQSH